MKVALRRIAPGSGWGNAGDGIQVGLEEWGVEVVAHDQPAPVVLHVLPPHFFAGSYSGSARWLFTMWETAALPEGALQGLGNFDGIIVPTEKDRALFAAVHPNVHKVNLGVDHEFYTPVSRRYDGGTFRFLYTAHSPHRKGGDVAEKAAAIVRGRGYDVELVPAVTSSQRVDVIEDPANRERHDEADVALRDLYHSCHAFLQPSRGEGWGMMPHQALATGMPAVISDCGGHSEYAWMPGVVLTETRMVPAALDFHGPAGEWWEPVLDDVAEKMIMVIDGYESVAAEAAKAPAVCRDRFDWSGVAAEIIALIGEDVLDRPDPTAAWVGPVWKEYPVRALRSVDCTIGEQRVVLACGQEAGLPWDQRRVLVASGAVEAT